jgi:hypothetical protein
MNRTNTRASHDALQLTGATCDSSFLGSGVLGFSGSHTPSRLQVTPSSRVQRRDHRHRSTSANSSEVAQNDANRVTTDAWTPWHRFLATANKLNILFEDREKVRSYLELHSDMIDVSESVCATARRKYRSAGLLLRVYRDPEYDDGYLSLIIRLKSYPVGTLIELLSVLEEHEGELQDKSGMIHVSTDYLPLR